MDGLLKFNKIENDEGKKKSYVTCNSRVEKSHTTLYFPGTRKHAEVGFHIGTNGTTPYKDNSRFYSHCSVAICIFTSLFLILAVRQQNSELCMMEQNVVALTQQVEVLMLASNNLYQNVMFLQDRVHDLIKKHHSNTRRFREKNINEVDVQVIDVVENVMDMENDSLDLTSESSDPFTVLRVSIPVNTTPDNFESLIIGDNDAADEVQENITESSLPSVMDIPLFADGSLAHDDDLTVGSVKLGRTKRSNKRGNQRPSGGRRPHPNKKSKNRGPSTVHFKGAVPEMFIEDGGLVAPWYADERGAGDFLLSKYQLREGKGAVEVTEEGLYYIYAQVYYLTTESLNSFSISLREEGKPIPEELALCSVNAPGGGRTSEVSCFTSVVRFLNATDRIFIRQRERNRRMILREGHSFFGLVHLNGINGNRGRK